MWIFLFLACEGPTEEVSVSGSVFSDRFDDSEPVAGARVQLLDAGLELSADLETNEAGGFSGPVASGGLLYIDLSAEGYATTSFSGSVGFSDLVLPDRTLWMRTDEELAEIRSEFEGCPGADDPEAGLIEGEVRYFMAVDAVDSAPLVESAWVSAADSESGRVEACYIGEDGTYDPEATLTGEAGRFALFGPSGVVTVEVGYEIQDEQIEATLYRLYVPGGGVAPFYPFWVSLPL